jgi:hypothetical protein
MSHPLNKQFFIKTPDSPVVLKKLKSNNHTLRQAQGEITKELHKGHKGMKYWI